MVKDVAKKVNQKYKSKIAWNADEYVKYKYHVEMARISAILNLMSEFNSWSTLSAEEEDHLDKIVKDLNDYLEYLERD